MRIRMFAVVSALAASVLAPTVVAQSPDPREKVLIRAAKPYDGLVARIEAAGGRVTHQFKYVDAVAAEVPASALARVRAVLGAAAVTKDEEIPAPASVDTLRGKGGLSSSGLEDEIVADAVLPLAAADLASLASAQPNAYLINNAIANVSPLHAGNLLGQGVIVAVIDSGIRPGMPHLSLDGSVIGCEDFVPDALPCSDPGNSSHGTFVAGMISANVVFTFSPASAFRNAILRYCPTCFVNPPTNTQVPMLGTAPLSSIYAFRVFGATGGAPTSRILVAVERVIELREMFDQGQAGGVNLQVCNMSLGGSTAFPGRDLFDTSVDVMLQKGIVTAIAAGNAGPSSLTIGSPGSSFGTLTVGAASLPHNERILRDLQFGPFVGALYRPFSGTQTAFFSSRGPNADGRLDPDVVSNGFANFGQGSGTPTTLNIGSGTSFATPSVTGVAALLRQGFPNASPIQIRNAIIMSANPTLIADGSTELDQGAGYVNGQGAHDLLAGGAVPGLLPVPPNPNKNVKVNIEHNTFLNTETGTVSHHVSNLQPGERFDILYRVTPNASQVVIALSGVTPALPPAQQNQLFGDDILLAIHTAKTSAIGQGDYPHFAFTTGGTFVVNNPETGIMRITVNGDWTNAGSISSDVVVFSTKEALPQFTTQGQIAHAQMLVFPLNIPAGVSIAEFRLGWREDWGSYPTNDIDMILISPTSAMNLEGATVNNPEFADLTNPAAGTWLVVVDGFEVASGSDKFELRVAFDGRVVK